MGTVTLKDDKGDEHRLVELRNPWGSEKWFGPWSDSSTEWTDDLRKQVDHLSDNDGKFFMSIEDYIWQIEYTEFNMDVTKWSHSYYSVIGDDEPVNRGAVFAGDDKEYNVHKLQFYSQVDQRVSFSVHRYHPKHYHGVC